MSDDSGTLSIDFLVGFTIFLIAFIWVLSMIPGLLIGLQAHTIDYDAVAYRTGVILVEDPGEPASWQAENYTADYNIADISRFGLAVSHDDPNILSLDKVDIFFNNKNSGNYTFYRNKAVFGDYPYRFNISLRYIGSAESVKSVGDVLPEGYGYIRRFVKVKDMSNSTIDGSNFTFLNGEHDYINGDDTTKTHIFSVLIENTILIGKTSPIKDPAYQIIPGRESFIINLTNLDETIVSPAMINQKNCFNISLDSIIVDDKREPPAPRTFIGPIIDDVLTQTYPQQVKGNVTLLYNTTDNRKGINWEAPQIEISFIFNLVPTGQAGCPSGSLFLNNTPGIPFAYDYNPYNVTQPQLRDAVVEVAVW